MQILLDLFMKFTVDFSFLNSLLFTDPNTTGINYSNGWWGGAGAGGGGGEVDGGCLIAINQSG